MKPLCFVLMPFGKKPTSDGRLVDFDAVYTQIIHPGIEKAGLEPLRADEEMVGGIIHKPMFERLVLCEYAVADLTTANANVFYELGVRHAARPSATQLLFAKGWGQLPFDVSLLRALPYGLTSDGMPADPAEYAALLANRLGAAQQTMTDSPVFQLLEGFPDIKHLKTDVFRERVRYAETVKAKLANARKLGEAAVADIEITLGDISHADTATVVDLFLSYRAVKAWGRMIDLAKRMAPPLVATVMIREQLGLALNRTNEPDEAERVLLDLINERGASSETCGILGRVYKDSWEAAVRTGNTALARGLLDKAINAYTRGFEADWRDAYPGINAVTLMELKDPPDPRRLELLPVVRYAVERRIAQGRPDYWDHATLLELAVIGGNRQDAEVRFADALAAMREAWEGETTARNLRLIREARETCGMSLDWTKEIESALIGSN